MTGRLGEINGRIQSARQIQSIVTVMRATAATRAKQARERLESVRSYATFVGQAIGRVLPLALDGDFEAARARPRGPHLVVAIGAEQGFAGGFSERVLEVVLRIDGSRRAPDALMLLGDRALLLARGYGLSPDWSASMPAHLDQIEAVADRVADQLAAMVASGASRVSLVYATPHDVGEIVSPTLFPFDFGRFPRSRNPATPLLNLPPDRLLARLAEDYVFAELCAAITLSFSAENEARMRAMTAARTHIGETLDRLTAQARQLRQEEITAEIVELAATSGQPRRLEPGSDPHPKSAGAPESHCIEVSFTLAARPV